MLIDNGNDMNITLIDFGFSVVRRPTDPLLDDYPGSPAYAAPELMQGIPYPGYSSDIWAMGVVLYILVTGEYPYWSEDRQDMYQQIVKLPLDFGPYSYLSKEVPELISWMLSKDWRKRPTIQQIKSHPWYLHWMEASSPLQVEPEPMDMEIAELKAPLTPKTPKSGKKGGSGRWTPNMKWKKRKLFE